MDHGFIVIVCLILYDYGRAFVSFVDDYVCILTEFGECSPLPQERLDWILTL